MLAANARSPCSRRLTWLCRGEVSGTVGPAVSGLSECRVQDGPRGAVGGVGAAAPPLALTCAVGLANARTD